LKKERGNINWGGSPIALFAQAVPKTGEQKRRMSGDGVALHEKNEG